MIEFTDAEQRGFDMESALPLIQGLTRLHEAIAVVDADDRVVWLSDGLAALCGGGRCFKGRPWFEVLGCPTQARHIAERIAECGRVSNEPIELRDRQGSAVRATVSAARLGEPGAHATVAIFRVEEPGRRDSELRLTLDTLSAILDSAPEGVVVVDRSRFISYANPAMCELTGWRREDLVDKPLALFLRAQEDLEQISMALGPESPLRSRDLEVRRRDGSPLCVNVSASLLRLPDGTQVGAVAYVRDVTERRRFERELERKNAELEHYVHAVSHDLRSPLVAMLGFSRLLREDYGEALGEKGQHFLRRIEDAGRTMESLIRHLLELSRIGKTEPDRRWVDPREVLLQLRSEIKPRLEAAGVELCLPDVAPLVWVDRTQLYQVLANLVGNALSHMGACAAPRITVAIDDVGGYHRVAVCDNGQGIDPADHERIFEIFQSLGPRRGDRSGSGLGLSIVKKIAENHDGRAWVESEPGKGADFFVTFRTP